MITKDIIETLNLINSHVGDLRKYLSKHEHINCAYAVGYLQAQVMALIDKLEIEQDEKLYKELGKALNKDKPNDKNFCCSSSHDYMQ